MGWNLPADHCPVTWCDEGTRQHRRHMGYLGSWIGTSTNNGRRAVTAQAVMYGIDEAAPRPALLLVDSAPGVRELGCELTWQQIGQLTAALTTTHQRFGT